MTPFVAGCLVLIVSLYCALRLGDAFVSRSNLNPSYWRFALIGGAVLVVLISVIALSAPAPRPPVDSDAIEREIERDLKRVRDRASRDF